MKNVKIPCQFQYYKFYDFVSELASKELILNRDHIYLESAEADRVEGLDQLIFINKELTHIHLFNEIYNVNVPEEDLMMEYLGCFKIDVVIYDESSDFENELHFHCGDQVFDFYNIDDLFDLELREKLFTSVQSTQKAA